MAIPRAFVSHSLALALALLLVVTPLCTAKVILYSGEILEAGKSLIWEKYEFKMKKDCNAVLYDSNEPIWASKTWGRGSSCYITLQPDGNLVIYGEGNSPVWASNTYVGGKEHYVLILQKDRNLVIYGPARWATNTNNRVSGGMFIESKATIFGALPSNKTTHEEAKTSGTIAMVVDNI
ncbi:alpha-D-mannose-specific plant lectins domain-containing protein [Dioscorea alata]|uniref:Alpha-D-mannose-specific plant lectins domain-containing protein n=1 Tax=Dioscorea alata TaxID=55571 RepID=A0ACB7U9M3_DIOAL|nr:alpha-D-mannose-specific plant lectins domain-containing protein [Dioscorea alata]